MSAARTERKKTLLVGFNAEGHPGLHHTIGAWVKDCGGTFVSHSRHDELDAVITFRFSDHAGALEAARVVRQTIPGVNSAAVV